MTYDYEHLKDCRQQLEQPEIPDQIFTGSEGMRLVMEVVSTENEAQTLIDEIGAQDPETEWGYKDWIEEAMFYPSFVVACRDANDGRAVGFMSFDTLVFIHDFGSGSPTSISVKVEPKVVYVIESVRGRGPGAAFIEILALQFPAVLDRLANMSQAQLSDLSVDRITVGMEAECVSPEGAIFVRKAFDAATERLSGHPRRGRWPAPTELANYIDYGGYDDDWSAKFP